FSSRRRHTRYWRDWSSDVCSSDLDDPDPTDTGHYEIYLFAAGTKTSDGLDGAAGLDLSYGAAPDLQLSLTLPVAFEDPRGGSFVSGVGNVELAAKYRILHQDTHGIDLSIFPR